MASTTFVDFSQNTPIVAAWLNDVNNAVYSPSGAVKKAGQSAAAWVRFSVSGGVATIQQGVNVASVNRTAVGVYIVTFTIPMTNITNCYSMNMSQAGFMIPLAEAAASVTVATTDTTNTAVDPASVSLVVFGAN